jgi:methyl-accepting chemotaxis protein
MVSGGRNAKLANRPPAWVTQGFVLLMVLLVSSTVTSSINAQRVLENNQWVRHTLVVRERLNGVLAGIVDTESVNRNFLLTGDESYIRDFEQRCAEVDSGIAELRDLALDNPRQVRELGRLRSLVKDKVDFMNHLISIRQTEGPSVSAEAVRTGVGL